MGMTVSRRVFVQAAAAALLVMPARLPAGQARVSVDAEGVAIRGYDTRAYWTAGAARPGSAAHVVQWDGAPWHFADAEEARVFAADPAGSAPQFGGFCTRAMSMGRVVDSDPEVWRIRDGRLYLFAAPKGGRVFDGQAAEMIAQAQAHWDSLS